MSATKETVLCAGAVQTPQVLLLSGIGPKEELARVKGGVSLVHDLPGVGRNLQDHLFVPMIWPVAAGYHDALEDNMGTLTKLKRVGQYLATGGGPASLSPVQACANKCKRVQPSWWC